MRRPPHMTRFSTASVDLSRLTAGKGVTGIGTGAQTPVLKTGASGYVPLGAIPVRPAVPLSQ